MVTMKLTDNEFFVISELIGSITTNKYRKAIGDKVVIQAEISFSKDTDKVLSKLNKKINS